MRLNTPIQLLILDLDDTIVDSSGSLVPQALKDSWEKMNQLGLDVTLDEFLNTRKTLLKEQPGLRFFDYISFNFPLTKEMQHLDMVEQRNKIALAGEQCFHERNIPPEIRLLPGAIETLTYFKDKIPIYLVTSGYPPTQWKKITTLKINSYFSFIYLLQKGTFKKEAFQEILTANQCTPENILCVGDRLDKEILDANELGFQTCHFIIGEHKEYQPQSENETPDYVIRDLSQLRELCHF